MTQADYDTFSGLIGETAKAFRTELSSDLITLYFRELADLSIEQVRTAFSSALRRIKFFPKIAELRDFVTMSAGDAAEIAWRTLESLCSEGHYPSIYVADPAFAYAVASFGGWLATADALRECNPEMLASYEKRFKASYRLGAERPGLARGGEYFRGFFEVDNLAAVSVLVEWAERGSGGRTYTVPVCVVSTAGYRKFDLTCDPSTGALTPAAMAMLQSGDGTRLQSYLPTRAPKLLGPMVEEEPEPITGEERARRLAGLRAQLGAMAGRRLATVEALALMEGGAQ